MIQPIVDFVKNHGSDWLESTATAAAFVVVARTLQLQLTDRREDQAAKVDYLVWVQPDGSPVSPMPEKITLGLTGTSWDQITLSIGNRSDRAINDVKIYLPFTRSGEVNADVVAVGKVPPGRYHITYLELDPNAAGRLVADPGSLIPWIEFRDGNGRIWRRTVDGQLQRRRFRRKLGRPGRRVQIQGTV